MASPLVQQRCLHHTERQAVARCPRCASYYCRECITEHDEQVVCASCLRSLLKPRTPEGEPRRHWLRRITRLPGQLGQLTLLLIGLLIIWSFFHLVGKGLLATPAKYHDATLWHSDDD